MVDDSLIFTKFPPGPLDVYRSQASFDWYDMKRFMDGEQELETKEHIWSILEKDPLFKQTTRGLSIEEKRRITFLRIKRLVEYDFLGEIGENFFSIFAFADAIGSLNWGLFAKFQLHHQVVTRMDYIKKLYYTTNAPFCFLTPPIRGKNLWGPTGGHIQREEDLVISQFQVFQTWHHFHQPL